jgi:hypothetical protein
MVTETQSPIAELLAKDPVLLAQVVNDLQLALTHSPGNGDQQKAEWSKTLGGFKVRYREYGAMVEPSQTHTDAVFGPIQGFGRERAAWFGVNITEFAFRGLFALSFPTNLTMCPCNHYLC